jgi:broad specificity phosphatase PhoE
MASRVLLVRHGETEWAAAGRHTGRTDIPLDEEGRRVARLLGERLARAPWNGLPDVTVRTSPLGRAVETCELAGFGEKAETWDELREYDYGDYEGRTTPDIRTEHPDWAVFRGEVPGGERLQDVAARADRVVEWARAAEGDVMLFGHGHFTRMVAVRWLRLDPGMGISFPLDAGALSVLGWAYGEPALARWNDTAHGEG